MSSRKLRIIILTLIILTLTVSTFVIGLFILNFYVKQSFEGEAATIDVYEYQYYQINKNTDVTSTGFITIPDEIPQGEYITYEDEYDNIVIISHMGLIQYEAEGNCRCLTSSKIELGEPPHVLGIPFLVSAENAAQASSLAAVRMEDICITRLQDVCKISEIDAEVTSVKKSKKKTVENVLNQGKENKFNKELYLCTGHCQPNGMTIFHQPSIEMFHRYGCEEMHRSGEVVVDDETYDELHQIGLKDLYIKLDFQLKFLDGWCEKNSLLKNPYAVFEDGEEVSVEYACDGGDMENPSVNCVLLEED